MLRASSKAITGERIETVDVLGGRSGDVPHGPQLVAFVDAVVGGDPAEANEARAALAADAGPGAVADAAAVLANFEMMTRLADGTGARQLPGRVASIADERARLGFDEFPSAR